MLDLTQFIVRWLLGNTSNPTSFHKVGPLEQDSHFYSYVPSLGHCDTPWRKSDLKFGAIWVLSRFSLHTLVSKWAIREKRRDKREKISLPRSTFHLHLCPTSFGSSQLQGTVHVASSRGNNNMGLAGLLKVSSPSLGDNLVPTGHYYISFYMIQYQYIT